MNRKDAIKSILALPALFTLKEIKPEKNEGINDGEDDTINPNNFVTIEGAMIAMVMDKHARYMVFYDPNVVENKIRELMTKYFSHIDHKIDFTVDSEGKWACSIHFKTQDTQANGKNYSTLDFYQESISAVYPSQNYNK